ncbi:hypothetical protein BY996DRAFT_6417732 [Phakopsora pachyrhizi]|nr:hypothetical protein BY996DRAFT_6417732 [Phakopsora pachyrhizi]
MNSGLRKFYGKSTKTHANSQHLEIGPSRVPKFDLNELPEESGSEMSNSEGKNVLKLGSERESIQASNKRLLDPLEDSVVSGDDQSSSKRLRAESSSTPETAPMQTRLVTEPEAERETPLVLERSHLKIVESNKNLQLSKPLLNDPGVWWSNNGFSDNLGSQRKKLTPRRKVSMIKSGVKQDNQLLTLGTGIEKAISIEEGNSIRTIETNFDDQSALMKSQKSSKTDKIQVKETLYGLYKKLAISSD